MNIVLWILQILLAVLFFFSGGMKLAIPPEVLKSMGSPNQVQFPGWFIQFIGVVEVLGGLGLILPSLLRIKPGLTPLAAAGLVIVMIGAVTVSIMGEGVGAAVVPFVVGVLLVFVAYERWKLKPIQGR